jgi:hypothetical protein
VTTRNAARQPATVAPAPTRTVKIGDPDNEGEVLFIHLRWLCPVPECRRPRGEPVLHQITYRHADGTPRTSAWVHRWPLDCGHVRLTHQLLAEAAELAASRQQPTNAQVPQPRNG